MQTVGSDHEVEPGCGAVLEGDGDTVGLLLDRADRVLEHVLSVVAGRLVQRRGQLTAHDLDVPT